MIKIENLTKIYGDLQVLKGINAQIQKGEVVAIIGPSGGGLEDPTSGHIFINGEDILNPKIDINKIRQKVSMVFQHFNLFANKSVLENLTLAPIKTGLYKKEEAEIKAINLLKKVGLESKKDEFPHKLSGGQKQRIAIARALAMNPDIILFDEPTSALDPETIGEVLGIMKEVAKDGLTMLVVTHEMGFARNVANRILFMENGLIAQDSDPKTAFENPQNPRLKEFLNKVLNH